MTTSGNEHRNNTPASGSSGPDTNHHAKIQTAIDGFGRWSEEQARKIADALYSEVRNDPLIRAIDAVKVGTDALGRESIFAIYSPHGSAGPFFHATVKVQAALSAPTSGTRENGIDQEGFLTDRSVVKHPVPELTDNNRQLTAHSAIVMHRTAGNSAASALEAFKSGIGAHFVIGKDGSILQTAGLDEQVSHVGKIKSRCDAEGTCAAKDQAAIDAMGWAPSKIHQYESKKPYPDRYPVNADSVGIEVVGNYDERTRQWDTPTAEQRQSIAKLVALLQKEFGLNDKDIYQHDIISYKTKGEGAGLFFADPPAFPGPDGVPGKGPSR